MLSQINKILVLGKTGNGKSTLCNYILGYKKFKESGLADRCTTNVQGCISKKYPDIFMIDTPGLPDPYGEDQKIINEIREELKTNHCNGIKAIILMVNSFDHIIRREDERIITNYCKMFPNPYFWEHVGIVFSNSYEGMKKKNITNEFIPKFHNLVEKILNEINKSKKQEKKIIIPQNFQYFFTDCESKDNNYKTDNEISRLINWAKSLDYLDFDK